MRFLPLLLALSGCLAAEAGSFYADGTGGGGGGGSSVTQAAYASCSASAAGDVCVSTDGPLWRVWDGAAWDDYLPGWGPVTPPACGDFAWVNQGSATCATVGGVMVATAPASAGNVAHLLVQSTPGSSWTADMIIQKPPYWAASIDASIVARDATGGDFIEALNESGANTATAWQMLRWSNATTFSSSGAIGGTMSLHTGQALHVRLASDGTTLTLSTVTGSGQVQTLLTETIATFVGTVDQVGIGIRTYGATVPAPFTVLHWSVQ